LIRIGDICIWNNGFPTKITDIFEKSPTKLGMISNSLITPSHKPIPFWEQTPHTSTLEKSRLIGLAPPFIIKWLRLNNAI
jgi:hypothetical protein